MATIDVTGNALFRGATITPYGGVGKLAISYDNASTATYYDSFGVNPGNYASHVFRIRNSDGSGSFTPFRVDPNSGGLVTVTGDFTVTGAKAFKVPHPLDETKDLYHACLEGPENGVFYRGEAQVVDGYAVVTLPDYFEALTYPDDRSVQLTQVWEDVPVFARLAASRVVYGQFTIHATDDVSVMWEVKAVRRIGVDRLAVVQEKAA